MRLADTVKRFATEIFTDLTDPNFTFQGKMNPFAEVTNSGQSSRRRILETPPGTAVPGGRAVSTPSGEKFLLGDPNFDFWHGSVIREKRPTLPIEVVGEAGTVGQFLEGAQDTGIYAHPFFTKRETVSEEMSDYYSGFEVLFPRPVWYLRGTVYIVGGVAYRLKMDTWIDSAGFSAAQAVKLENPLQTFTVVNHTETYNPATDSYTAVTIPAVNCFVEPLSQAYEFVSPSFTGVDAGDTAISILASIAALDVNDVIGDYRVLSKRSEGIWATYQCRAKS